MRTRNLFSTSLLSNTTDLQINYNFNMVAIDEISPLVKRLGLCQSCLVISPPSWSHFWHVLNDQGEEAEKRLHIVEGLVVSSPSRMRLLLFIRASENKRLMPRKTSRSAMNLPKRTGYEATVTATAHRLANTAWVVLQEEEEAELREDLAMLALSSVTNETMYNLNREVKKKFATPRLVL